MKPLTLKWKPLLMQKFSVNHPVNLFVRALMETDPEEHRLNYERFRTLVMIDYSGGQSISHLLLLSIGHTGINKQYCSSQGTSCQKTWNQVFMQTQYELTMKCEYVQTSHTFRNIPTYISRNLSLMVDLSGFANTYNKRNLSLRIYKVYFQSHGVSLTQTTVKIACIVWAF